ncbi:hypothetical protein Sjap_018696 [Stephania japonica]|uniref:Uncharacterized protein n=1 Tax=Stephania japonica TaxID=461633 RepID=A0AAP0NNH4_9MAGN
MYEVKGEGQKGHLMLYIYKPFHNKTLLFIHYSSSPLLKTAAPSFSSISTSSPHHSRSLSLPLHFTLAVLSRSPSPRSSSLTLSVLPSRPHISLALGGLSRLEQLSPPPPLSFVRSVHDLAGTLTEAGLDNWSAV